MFKAAAYRLIILPLIIIQLLVLFTGCTIIGLSAGVSSTMNEERYTSINTNPDSCRCRSGEVIEIVMTDGNNFTGRITDLVRGEQISIKITRPQTTDFYKGDVEAVTWSDIHSITRIDTGYTGINIMLMLGVLLDALFVAMLFTI